MPRRPKPSAPTASRDGQTTAIIDAFFAIEREINGLTPETRLAAKAERSRPILLALEGWLKEQRARLSSKSAIAGAIEATLCPAGRPKSAASLRA